MGRGKRLQIELTQRDRRQLDELLSGGLQPVRTILRALALRQMDQGQSTPAVATNLGLSAKAVWQIGTRYEKEGLDRALFDASRPGKASALDQRQSQQIIAVVCSPPPEGRARWTVRLLTEEVIKRKLVPRVGRETIRVLLESHDLKPWREKNVVRGEIGQGVHRLHGGRAQDLREAAVGARTSGLRRRKSGGAP
jgi:transposase